MVINDKALLSRLKEAYKEGGYTVAAVDEKMMLTNGHWLAIIDRDNVPSEVLALLALHIRDIPAPGDAYKVIKTKEGAFAQAMVTTEAVSGWARMVERIRTDGTGNQMKRAGLTLGGMLLYQEVGGEALYMIDPRDAVLIVNRVNPVRLGNGIYALGETSELWVLRYVEGALEDPLEHLKQYRWVE